MRKILKKSICIILCLIMISASAVSTLAASGFTTVQRDIPRIFVNGFMASDVYVDPENPNSKKAWPLSSDDILGAVSEMAEPLAKLALGGTWQTFADELVPVVDELFAPVSSDFSGDVTNGSGIRFEYPAPEEITEDSYVEFCYDWRKDPIETADALDKFINYVTECAGTEQVTLDCHSCGGVITFTYLKLYGTEKIRSVLFNATAIYGETYTGELLSGKIVLNDAAVKNYLDYAFDGMEFENLLSLLMGSVTDAGVTAFICEYANDIVDLIYDQVSLSIAKLFANWPTIWAMIPDEMLDDAKNHVFNEIYANANVDFSGLKDKIENYDTLIRADKTQSLLDINETTNTYVISRYGYSSLPMTESWEILSDGVIDTKHNSFGATTAKFNKTLNVPVTEYVNPDKTVDASTCLFPEQTWFIKNIKHSDMPKCVDMLIEHLLYHDGQATVETFKEYPRFLEYNIDYNSLQTDKKSDYVAFWDRLIAMIMEIFSKLFG